MTVRNGLGSCGDVRKDMGRCRDVKVELQETILFSFFFRGKNSRYELPVLINETRM